MRGWRTLIFNFAVAMVVAVLTFIAGVDWNAYGLRPEVGLILVSIANIALRCVTTTPPFISRSDDPDPPVPR